MIQVWLWTLLAAGQVSTLRVTEAAMKIALPGCCSNWLMFLRRSVQLAFIASWCFSILRGKSLYPKVRWRDAFPGSVADQAASAMILYLRLRTLVFTLPKFPQHRKTPSVTGE